MGAVSTNNTSITTVLPLHINGEDIPAENTFPVYNPLTEELLYYCSSASIEDAKRAIQVAEDSFEKWRNWPPSAKRKLFLKTAEILETKEEEVRASMSSEISAVSAWCTRNIAIASAALRELSGMVTHIKGEIVPADRPKTTLMIVREPCGTVLAISPWNSPLILTIRAIGLPMICGNSVILKPSENSPKSQRIVVDSFIEAGLPAGVLQYLPVRPADAAELTEFIIMQPSVRRVNFTGSDRVGRIIAGYASKALKPCVLELGGKNPALVLDDANIGDAVGAVTFAGLGNSGQVCMSTDRVLVAESIAEEFVKELVQRASRIKVGNHIEDPSVQMSGLFSKASAARCVMLIQDALDKGAKLLLGDAKARGTIVLVHILDYVTPEMKIWDQETFGPVLCITRVKSDEEALMLANKSDYSLSASIYSQDAMRALKISRKLRSGSTHINGPTIYSEPTLPNGGTGGGSGYGRFGGIHGIAEFTDLKIISLQEEGQMYPL